VRIAIALRDASSLSGVSRVARSFARVLSGLGHEVFLITHRLPKSPWGLDPLRVRWVRAPMLSLGSACRAASFDFFARRAARRIGADSLWGNGDLTAQDLLFANNCDAAYGEFIGPDRRPSAGTAFVRSRQFEPSKNPRIVAVSRLVARDLQRFYGVPPERVRVVHLGVDSREFHPGPRARRENLRVRLGIPPDAFVALSLISGDSRKRNIPALARAFHRARLPESSRLLLVGSEVRGLGPRCVACGPTADPAEVYGAADLFALPALYEEFGLTVLEAMACGTPVLVSSRVGACELVEDGRDGFLLEDPRDEEALRALLERACLARDLPAMGEVARRTALRHTWERAAELCLDYVSR
jgi:UDP-glucose:(heptosyl)LPS alpha-1,3-glucosyltransferase